MTARAAREVPDAPRIQGQIGIKLIHVSGRSEPLLVAIRVPPSLLVTSDYPKIVQEIVTLWPDAGYH